MHDAGLIAIIIYGFPSTSYGKGAFSCMGYISAKQFVPGFKRGQLTLTRKLMVLCGARLRARWECICDCGEHHIAFESNISGGTSCCSKCTSRSAPLKKIKHGLSKTVIYNTWATLKDRCLNSNSTHFKDYGGRGIKVCAAIRDDVVVLHSLLGDKPTKKHSIDRIDNEGNYSCGACPDCIANGWTMNVRWATSVEQNRNTRRNVWITIEGNPLILTDAAAALGISPTGLSKALKDGRFTTTESVLEWLNREKPPAERRQYPNGMSRQRFHQIQNNLRGMCCFHSKRPVFNDSRFCKECTNKNRSFARKKTGRKGNPLQKEDWAAVDFSKGPNAVAREHGVKPQAAFQQMIKRGWRKIWVGPHQEVVTKQSQS